MSRLCLYYKQTPERDRWFPGDRFLRPLARRLIRGKRRPGGLDKVFINLKLGLNQLGISYVENLPFRKLSASDRVAVLGRGRECLAGYDRSNPIVAGIGLMTWPTEWPTLCEDYPVVRYLQHSQWAAEVYRPFFGDRCRIWPVGIDTDYWSEDTASGRTVDFLIYRKIHWERERKERELIEPILAALTAAGCTYDTVTYGSYNSSDYRTALARSRAMVFLSEHESQGIALEEAMSTNLPILAWDQGFVADPERLKWGLKDIPASSVPYFDERCGLRFRDAAEFSATLPTFLAKLRAGQFRPRAYVLENLTLKKCARQFVEIVEEAYEGR